VWFTELQRLQLCHFKKYLSPAGAVLSRKFVRKIHATQMCLFYPASLDNGYFPKKKKEGKTPKLKTQPTFIVVVIFIFSLINEFNKILSSSQ
jgi:hypothetical protein